VCGRACVKAQFGLHVRLEDGKRVVDTDEDGGDGDGAREAPGARRTEAQPQVSGGYAIFYDRSNSSGDAFIVHAPDFIPDLSDLRRGRHGDWNNQVSSVSTKAGGIALICLKKQCNGGPTPDRHQTCFATRHRVRARRLSMLLPF
jgi:hypothetical protein